MTDDNGIIFGWTIDGNGGGRRLDNTEVAEEIRNAGLAWVHLDATHESTRDWLTREITCIDSLIIDALLADETRPRTVDYGDGMLLILRGVNLNPDEQPEDMVSLRMWIDDDRIITIERREVHTTRIIDDKLKAGTGPRSAGGFLSMLCAQLFDYMDLAQGRLHDRLDALEEQILAKPEEAQRGQTLDIRRAAITFRRYIAPQRDVLAHLRYAEQPWIDANQKRGFQEDLDQVIRSLEDLDLMRERAQIAHETLNSAMAQRVNKNLYLLSGIATIFMPLTFVTGLFGMNVEGIPFDNHPSAFTVICMATLGMALIQALIFKLMKWF